MMLVEHDVAFVARLADRVAVLDLGRLIAEGTRTRSAPTPPSSPRISGRGRMSPVIEVSDLVVRYGTATALDRVGLTVRAGSWSR